MEDAVKPSKEAYHDTYAASFKLWSALRQQVLANPILPPCAFSLINSFRHWPPFPPIEAVKHQKNARDGFAYAAGFSEWTALPSVCELEMPSLRHLFHLLLTTKYLTGVTIDLNQQNDGLGKLWPSLQGANYISILILAWAYILSARWAELMPGRSTVAYTNTQAPNDSAHLPVFKVYIGSHSPKEARWWTAVLAQRRGWQATVALGQDEFVAPWSVSLINSPNFVLSGSINSPPTPSKQNIAASFLEATRYLDKFCAVHGLENQSLAALTAAIMIPSAFNKLVILPALRLVNIEPRRLPLDFKPLYSTRERSRVEREPCCVSKPEYLDRLLTLSCSTGGVRSLLEGVFFEPDIECNKAGAWIQGGFDVVNPLVDREPWVLGRMLMERLPESAPLWFGATILGLQKGLLAEIGCGSPRVNLSAAAWTGTVQSFIQQPRSELAQDAKNISRADESRLLYLTQTRFRPDCPWAPFGETPFEATDLEARHVLEYKGFSWGNVRINSHATTCNKPRHPIPAYLNNLNVTIPLPEGLVHSKESVSMMATRSIFDWLRPDGFNAQEKEIMTHGWINPGPRNGDSNVMSQDEEAPIQYVHVPYAQARIQSWIDGVGTV
ncbi:hypothetical protein B0T10DRAFT_537309 [Thelonectria olida]|uniref:Uncharacterized protein n=1 Tax=Thelonectria olida TaxID=1576542 RepID=A0A9P8W8A3_9HYPO|nr:hypothetical protein B0T10DRAFT_537309 [Thelonectria olida]